MKCSRFGLYWSLALVVLALSGTYGAVHVPAGKDKDSKADIHPTIPLKIMLRFWSTRAGSRFVYPGKRSPSSFAAILWVRAFRTGNANPIRALSLVVRNARRFILLQTFSNGLVGYSVSDGDKFLSVLLDPRGSGSLAILGTHFPLLQTSFGYDFSTLLTELRICAIAKPSTKEPAFFMCLCKTWFRAISRHCVWMQYDNLHGILRLRTRGPNSITHARIGYSWWPERTSLGLKRVFISAVDIQDVKVKKVAGFNNIGLHLRIAADGRFWGFPKHKVNMTHLKFRLPITHINRLRFVHLFVKISGLQAPISRNAAAARRRFLNWAVGPAEARVLDGWIYNGTTPLWPIAKIQEAGSK